MDIVTDFTVGVCDLYSSYVPHDELNITYDELNIENINGFSTIKTKNIGINFVNNNSPNIQKLLNDINNNKNISNFEEK